MALIPQAVIALLQQIHQFDVVAEAEVSIPQAVIALLQLRTNKEEATHYGCFNTASGNSLVATQCLANILLGITDVSIPQAVIALLQRWNMNGKRIGLWVSIPQAVIALLQLLGLSTGLIVSNVSIPQAVIALLQPPSHKKC